MGSPAEAAYRKLQKRLGELKDVRERPEKPGSPFAKWAVKPTLWLQGKRFLVFFRDEDRRLLAGVRVPEGFAEDVPEAVRMPEGDLEAVFDLADKNAIARAEEIARLVHERMTGSRVT